MSAVAMTSFQALAIATGTWLIVRCLRRSRSAVRLR